MVNSFILNYYNIKEGVCQGKVKMVFFYELLHTIPFSLSIIT